MKTKLVRRIASCSLFACALASLIATVPLGTSATAAPVPGAPNCNHTMLHGLYLWTLEGYQYFGGNPVPKNLIATIQFYENGTFIGPFGTVNIGGVSFDSSGFVGTYTLNGDCTGTMQVAGATSFSIFVGSDGKQITTLQTGGGPGDGTGVGLGMATRQ